MCLSNSSPSSRNSARLTRGEPPLTGATLPASFSPWFVLICFSIDLSLVSLFIAPSFIHATSYVRLLNSPMYHVDSSSDVVRLNAFKDDDVFFIISFSRVFRFVPRITNQASRSRGYLC